MNVPNPRQGARKGIPFENKINVGLQSAHRLSDAEGQLSLECSAGYQNHTSHLAFQKY